MSIIPVILFLLLVVAVGWVAFWFIDQGVPEPMRMLARLAVAIAALVAIFSRFYPGSF